MTPFLAMLLCMSTPLSKKKSIHPCIYFASSNKVWTFAFDGDAIFDSSMKDQNVNRNENEGERNESTKSEYYSFYFEWWYI